MAVNKQNSRKFEMKSDKTYKEHKEQLEKQFHIVGHPKADLLYKIASEFGRIEEFEDYNEIEYYYFEMIALLK